MLQYNSRDGAAVCGGVFSVYVACITIRSMPTSAAAVAAASAQLRVADRVQ